MGDDRDACCKSPPPYTGCPYTTAPSWGTPCRPLEDAGFHCYTDAAAHVKSVAAAAANDLAGMTAGIVEAGKKLTDSCPAGTFKGPPYTCGNLFDFIKLSDASPDPDRGTCEHYNERCCAKATLCLNNKWASEDDGGSKCGAGWEPYGSADSAASWATRMGDSAEKCCKPTGAPTGGTNGAAFCVRIRVLRVHAALRL
jgi:hypothetical protein